MESKTWQIIAVISWFITGSLIGLIIWSYNDLVDEEEKTYECYYEICTDNYDAFYENNVCTCYDLDIMGEYVVDKQKYMK